MPAPNGGLLTRWNGWASIWLARIAALLVAGLALMTFADVFARYLFNSPFSFTIEITELTMGVIVYFGLGLVTHENSHVSVDILTSRLRRKLRAAVALVVDMAALAYLAVLVWRVWERAFDLHALGDVTQILLMPLWPGALAMAVGSVFLLTGVLLQFARSIGDLVAPGGAANDG